MRLTRSVPTRQNPSTVRGVRGGPVVAVAAAGLALALAACGSPGSPGAAGEPGTEGVGESRGSEPIPVGLVYSKTGPLATYGQQYLEGFHAGLDYATDGTGQVDGRDIDVSEVDDAGDPAKAVAAATDLIGQGTKVLAGSTSSGVALQVAPLAEENGVLFISGPAATDGLTGVNDHTFRSGRQTYQDILTAATFLGDVKGKKVTVFAQDSAFGQANVAAVEAVLGAQGATVTALPVNATATDLTPFARQAVDGAPDLLFVAWAGANASQMWQSLQQQGAFEATTVVTGLDIKASYPAFGESAAQISFLSHFFDGAGDNEAYNALAESLGSAGEQVDLFTNDGFVAAQMVVHALSESPDEVDGMVEALEGWTFEGPKGQLTIRAEDHAVLQPMFQARLVADGDGWRPELVETLEPDAVAPPVASS